MTSASSVHLPNRLQNPLNLRPILQINPQHIHPVRAGQARALDGPAVPGKGLDDLPAEEAGGAGDEGGFLGHGILVGREWMDGWMGLIRRWERGWWWDMDPTELGSGLGVEGSSLQFPPIAGEGFVAADFWVLRGAAKDGRFWANDVMGQGRRAGLGYALCVGGGSTATASPTGQG